VRKQPPSTTTAPNNFTFQLSEANDVIFRAPLAGLRLWLKRLRLWLWQNNGFFGEAEAIL
jgi:hypothetical protein